MNVQERVYSANEYADAHDRIAELEAEVALLRRIPGKTPVFCTHCRKFTGRLTAYSYEHWRRCPKNSARLEVERLKAQIARMEHDGTGDPEEYIVELEAEIKRLQVAHVQGGDPEFLGQLVRKAWIEWAKEQPSPKPGWCVPWDKLTEPEREVDRRIGLAIANVCVTPELLQVEAEVMRLRKFIAKLGYWKPTEASLKVLAEIRSLVQDELDGEQEEADHDKLDSP